MRTSIRGYLATGGRELHLPLKFSRAIWFEPIIEPLRRTGRTSQHLYRSIRGKRFKGDILPIEIVAYHPRSNGNPARHALTRKRTEDRNGTIWLDYLPNEVTKTLRSFFKLTDMLSHNQQQQRQGSARRDRATWVSPRADKSKQRPKQLAKCTTNSDPNHSTRKDTPIAMITNKRRLTTRHRTRKSSHSSEHLNGNPRVSFV